MKRLLTPIIAFFVIYLLMLAARGAEKVTDVGWETLTIPSGSYTRSTNGPLSWNIESGAIDIVSVNHAVAPLGTTGNFFCVFTNSYTVARHNLTSLTVGGTYVLSFKAARPANSEGWLPDIYFGVRSSLNTSSPIDSKDWIVKPFPAVYEYNEEAVSGTWPNIVRTIAPPAYWATNKWASNSVSFVAKTSTMVLELHSSSPPWADRSILIDSVSVTGN